MAAGKASASLQSGSEPVFDIVCIPCNSEGKHLEAEGYCVDCSEHLCVQCYKYHRTLSAVKHHKLIDKENMPLDQKDSVGRDICTETCNTHKDKIIEYFCPTHDVLGCSVCMTLQHKQCKDAAYIPEVSVGIEHSQEYKNFKQQLDLLIHNADVMFKSSKQNLKTSADLYARAQQDIRTFRQEINTALDRLETEMKMKLEKLKIINSEGLQEANNVKDDLQAISADFQRLISKKQNCKMFTQMKYTESSLSRLQKKLKSTNLQVFKFYPNQKLLQALKGADFFGKMLVKNTSKIRADFVDGIKIRSKRDYDTFVTSMSMVSREKLVFIDRGNNAVKLIGTVTNKITPELQLDCFSLPWNVTAIAETKIAVTQPEARRIVVMSLDDGLSVDTVIYVQDKCCGIAYYQNQLIVTFVHPGRLEILSMTGDVMQRFEYDDQGRQMLIDPRFVSVDTEEPAMFVSDWDNGSLVKLSMGGKVLAVYKDHELSKPGQCVIDQTCLISLCGADSNNVHLLTTKCSKLKTLLTQSDGMRRPMAISYCATTGRLYVGMNINDSIKVYQLHD